MRRYINSMFYGSTTTKKYLWTVFVLLVCAFSFLFAGAVARNILFWGAAVIIFAVALFVFRSVSFEDAELENEKGKKVDEEEVSDSAGKKKIQMKQETAADEPEIEDEEENPYEQYNENELKKIMVKYKVKKLHKPVMIDLCSEHRVLHCPAYVWKERGEVCFLLLEKKPRTIILPLSSIGAVGYERAVTAYPGRDYSELKEHIFMNTVFSSYLPTYHTISRNGRRAYVKNLYVIAQGLKVTNTSARNLFDILEVDFELEDKVTLSGYYSEYFKMAYKANVLWKDGVIDSSEYRNRIKEILGALTTQDISIEAFQELIIQLVENKLITMEYAEYYKEQKIKEQEVSRKKVEKARRKRKN